MSHGVGGSALDDFPFPKVRYVIVEGPPKIMMSPF